MTVDTQMSNSETPAVPITRPTFVTDEVNVMELVEVIEELTCHVQSLLHITLSRDTHQTHSSTGAPSVSGDSTVMHGGAYVHNSSVAVDEAECGIVKCIEIIYKALWFGPLLPIAGDDGIRSTTINEGNGESDNCGNMKCVALVDQCICNIDSMRTSFERLWVTDPAAAGISSTCDFYSSHHYLKSACEYGPNIVLLILLLVRDYLLMMRGEVSEASGEASVPAPVLTGVSKVLQSSESKKRRRHDARKSKNMFRQDIKRCEQLLMRLVSVLRCNFGHYNMSGSMSSVGPLTPDEQSMDMSNTINSSNGSQREGLQWLNIVKHDVNHLTPTLTEVLFPASFFRALTLEILKRIHIPASTRDRSRSAAAVKPGGRKGKMKSKLGIGNTIEQNVSLMSCHERNSIGTEYIYRSFLLSREGIHMTRQAEALVYQSDSEWDNDDFFGYGPAHNTSDRCNRDSTSSPTRSPPLDSKAMSLFTFISQKRVPPLLLVLMDNDSHQQDNYTEDFNVQGIVKRDKCLFDAVWCLKAGYDDVCREYFTHRIPHSNSESLSASPSLPAASQEQTSPNQYSRALCTDTTQQQKPQETALCDRFRPPPLLPPLLHSSSIGSTITRNITISDACSPTATIPAHFAEFDLCGSSSTSLLQDSNPAYFDFEFLESIGADSGSTSSRSLSPISCPSSSLFSYVGASSPTTATEGINATSTPVPPTFSFSQNSNITRSNSPLLQMQDSKGMSTQLRRSSTTSLSPTNTSAVAADPKDFRNIRLEAQKKKKNGELLSCSPPANISSITDRIKSARVKRDTSTRNSTSLYTRPVPTSCCKLGKVISPNSSNMLKGTSHRADTVLFPPRVSSAVATKDITSPDIMSSNTGSITPTANGNKRCRSLGHIVKTCYTKGKKGMSTPTKATQQTTSGSISNVPNDEAPVRPKTPNTPHATVLLDLLREGGSNTAGEAVEGNRGSVIDNRCVATSFDDSDDYDDIYLERSPKTNIKRVESGVVGGSSNAGIVQHDEAGSVHDHHLSSSSLIQLFPQEASARPT